MMEHIERIAGSCISASSTCLMIKYGLLDIGSAPAGFFWATLVIFSVILFVALLAEGWGSR